MFGSGRRGWREDKKIGVGLSIYQSCANRGSVGTLSVFGLQWCRWGVGRGFGPGSEVVGCCYVCVSCEYEFSV